MHLGDRIKGGTTLTIIFDRTKNSNQYTLSVFCKAFIISEIDEDITVYGNLMRDEKNKAI